MDTPVILLAEDQANEALLLRRAFVKAAVPHRLEVVCDGDEAIAYLEGQDSFSNREKHPLPDLLLLDLKMPRKDGFEVLQWLKERSDFHDLPVVILTTSDEGPEVRLAYQSGATSYLVKPVAMKEFVELAKKIQEFWLPKPKELSERESGVESRKEEHPAN